jgi:hypothetical protein
MKEFGVFVQFPWSDEWQIIWKDKAESFDLTRFVIDLSSNFDSFDPYNPKAMKINFSVLEYDEDHYFGREIASDNALNIYLKWLNSVKEVL